VVFSKARNPRSGLFLAEAAFFLFLKNVKAKSAYPFFIRTRYPVSDSLTSLISQP
jgi:hypothetical protein